MFSPRFVLILVFTFFVGPLSFAAEKVLECLAAENPRESATIRLRVVSFNDFHGNYREKETALGAAKFLCAIQDYKRQFPRDYPTAIYVVSAGDFLSGTALSYYSTFDPETGGEKAGNPVNRFFAEAGVHSACIGNHLFDWGPEFLEDHLDKTRVQIGEKSFPAYSSSNIVRETDDHPPGNVPKYDVISLCVNQSEDHEFLSGSAPIGSGFSGSSGSSYEDRLRRFKIAVLTLTTLETATKSMPGATKGYVIERPSESARNLMEQIRGVDAFLFLTHLGAYQDERGKITFGGDETEMLELVKLKPLAIISAHSHKFIAGEVRGVPIIQAGSYGNGLASLSFLIDTKNKSVRLESRESVDLRKEREKWIPDAKMEKIVEEIIGSCSFTTVGISRGELRRNLRGPCALGALVSKALSVSFPRRTGEEPVLSFRHSGGIRADLPGGPITEELCFDIFPFHTPTVLCRLSGEKVFRLMREGFRCPHGYLQSFALRYDYDCEEDAPEDFKRVSFVHKGREMLLEPDREYWVVIDSFLVAGGDGYSRDIFEGSVIERNGPLPRDALIEFFRAGFPQEITLEDEDLVISRISPSHNIPCSAERCRCRSVPSTQSFHPQGTPP